MGTHSDGKKIVVGGFSGSYFDKKKWRESDAQLLARITDEHTCEEYGYMTGVCGCESSQ